MREAVLRPTKKDHLFVYSLLIVDSSTDIYIQILSKTVDQLLAYIIMNIKNKYLKECSSESTRPLHYESVLNTLNIDTYGDVVLKIIAYKSVVRRSNPITVRSLLFCSAVAALDC